MKPIPEHRLFGRIVILAFLLGLVFGPAGLFMGIRIYKFFLLGFDPLAPSAFGWPLDALQIILDGAFLVLLITVADLCSQFLKGSQWKNSRSVLIQFCTHFSRVVGFLSMGVGVSLLIEKLLNLPNPKLSSLQELVVNILLILLFLLGAVCLSWCLLVRDKRRSALSSTQ